jgi:hypothetical protein
MDKRKVSIKLVTLPDEDEQKGISEKIRKHTGYTLDVST